MIRSRSALAVLIIASWLLIPAMVMAQEEPLPGPAQPGHGTPAPMPVHPQPPPPQHAPPPPGQPGYAPSPHHPTYAQPYPPHGAFAPRVSTRESRPNVIYAEIMGKGGLYGIGYDRSILPWLGVGAAFSYYDLFGARAMFICPYLNLYPIAGVKNALLVQAGPEIIYAWASTGMINWAGDSAMGVGGQLSAGYEYRGGFVFRLLFTTFFGAGGALPWGGMSFGGSF